MRCDRTDDNLATATSSRLKRGGNDVLHYRRYFWKKRVQQLRHYIESRADWRVHFMPDFASSGVWLGMDVPNILTEPSTPFRFQNRSPLPRRRVPKHSAGVCVHD